MTITAVVFLAVPRLLARAFTSDAAVVALAAALIPIAGVFQVFDGGQAVGAGVLRGAGDTTAPLLRDARGVLAGRRAGQRVSRVSNVAGRGGAVVGIRARRSRRSRSFLFLRIRCGVCRGRSATWRCRGSWLSVSVRTTHLRASGLLPALEDANAGSTLSVIGENCTIAQCGNSLQPAVIAAIWSQSAESVRSRDPLAANQSDSIQRASDAQSDDAADLRVVEQNCVDRFDRRRAQRVVAIARRRARTRTPDARDAHRETAAACRSRIWPRSRTPSATHGRSISQSRVEIRAALARGVVRSTPGTRRNSARSRRRCSGDPCPA